MKAPITDKQVLEMMWERFPEIMKRGTEQPAPVQQEPVYVQTRHKEDHGWSEWGSLLDPAHRNSKWAAGVEMRLLYTSPQPAQRKPLTKQARQIIHDATGSMRFFEAVEYAITQTEAAHNIKEQP